MREIKFRACDKDKKVMYRVRNILWINQHISSVMLENGEGLKRLDDIVLMQYTGRKDSEGKEIYEGDILESEHFFRYQVVFKGDCWRCEPLKHSRLKNRFIGRDLKVIGNIHENKDLLED